MVVVFCLFVFPHLLYSYEVAWLRTKPKCNYTSNTYFCTLITKFVKQVEDRTWEIYMPAKQKWDRSHIKLINPVILQNYQHQLCLVSLLVTGNKKRN